MNDRSETADSGGRSRMIAPPPHRADIGIIAALPIETGDLIDKLNKAFVDALNAPETKTRFAALLAEPVATTPEQFSSFMAAERAKYQQVVKASGAKVD